MKQTRPTGAGSLPLVLIVVCFFAGGFRGCRPRNFNDSASSKGSVGATPATTSTWIDAQGFHPLTSIRGLESPRPEFAFASRKARPAWVDYDLLVRDFPFLRQDLGLGEALGGSDGEAARWLPEQRAKVDAWLVAQFGFVSARQAGANVTNTAIPIVPLERYEALDLNSPNWRDADGRNQAQNSGVIEKLTLKMKNNMSRDESLLNGLDVIGRKAFRPKDYGRALVFPVVDAQGVERGLIDAKGAGVTWGIKAASQGDHANGLATLGEAIRELTMQRMVAHLIKKDGLEAVSEDRTLGTVAIYGVLDLGFEVKLSREGRLFRAGLILRQAHDRIKVNGTAKDVGRFVSLFCKYGIVGWLGKQSVNTNLQSTPSAALYDFGTVGVEKSGAEVFKNCGVQRPLSEEKRVSFDTWGYKDVADPMKDNPWVYAHDTADAFVANGDRSIVEKHLTNMLSSLR